jgi:predicted NBD/HSP70 family sugar kinase
VEALRRILGIDVGATKTAAALVERWTGEVVLEESIQTKPEGPGVEVLEGRVDRAERVAAGRPADAVPAGTL